MTMEPMGAETCRSPCHQGLFSALVAVTDPPEKAPLVLPSTAAPAGGVPGMVLLCAAGLLKSRLNGDCPNDNPVVRQTSAKACATRTASRGWGRNEDPWGR